MAVNIIKYEIVTAFIRYVLLLICMAEIRLYWPIVIINIIIANLSVVCNSGSHIGNIISILDGIVMIGLY